MSNEMNTGGGAAVGGGAGAGRDFTGRDRISIISAQDRDTLFHLLNEVQMDVKLASRELSSLPGLRRDLDDIGRSMARVSGLEHDWDRRMETMQRDWERRLATIQADWEKRFAFFEGEWGRRLIPLYVGVGLSLLADVANLIW